MKKVLPLAVAMFTIGACVYPASDNNLSATSQPGASPASDYDRLSFVQAACGSCHAVEPPALSPNPMSPAFVDIANREGLTRASLVTWLTDAHNYPEMMDFDLDPPQVEGIADYILTLGSNDYVRRKD